MKSLNMFLNLYKTYGTGQRLGQYFCNQYGITEKEIEGLFYEENETKAINMIRYWLIENKYCNDLPNLRIRGIKLKRKTI